MGFLGDIGRGIEHTVDDIGDKAGKVVYSEIVPEVTSEPNYEAAMAALKSNA